MAPLIEPEFFETIQVVSLDNVVDVWLSCDSPRRANFNGAVVIEWLHQLNLSFLERLASVDTEQREGPLGSGLLTLVKGQNIVYTHL